MRYIIAILLSFAVTACSHTSDKIFDIQTEEITYKAAGKEMTGYVARPKVEGPQTRALKPAVLVVHEWWGQTDYPRKRAEMLAELGYIAMAVDMYGDRKIADHPKDAGGFAKTAMKSQKTVAQRFNGALEAIKKQAGVDPDKVAAIGYCFGGSVVMEMAKQGAPLQAVVSFHGGLETPTTAEKSKEIAPMLVLNGAKDPMVTEKQIKNFKQTMESAGAEYKFINYEDALHGFTNPAATRKGKKFGLPLGYDRDADKKSWAQMKKFLEQKL